ncbi:hypothetical protein DIS24_g5092 [Lasiodiplodia hormozganensis]|uniref:Uncharacterized protein n=1 Tax=Lasiodiplodia hormozganensis TaxID=869390 RepID=A0AA39YL57_9PEZI|nr:hypothetical protein DIS24_g5092 [Lasiodiplodia hormozganensis]
MVLTTMDAIGIILYPMDAIDTILYWVSTHDSPFTVIGIIIICDIALTIIVNTTEFILRQFRKLGNIRGPANGNILTRLVVFAFALFFYAFSMILRIVYLLVYVFIVKPVWIVLYIAFFLFLAQAVANTLPKMLQEAYLSIFPPLRRPPIASLVSSMRSMWGILGKEQRRWDWPAWLAEISQEWSCTPRRVTRKNEWDELMEFIVSSGNRRCMWKPSWCREDEWAGTVQCGIPLIGPSWKIGGGW